MAYSLKPENSRKYQALLLRADQISVYLEFSRVLVYHTHMRFSSIKGERLSFEISEGMDFSLDAKERL